MRADSRDPRLDLASAWRPMERHESAFALEAFATSNAWCDDYRHEGDLGIQGRETFRAPEGVPEHHVYVCPADSFTLRQHLIFRDYLRSHPDEAKTYGELKMALAGQFVHDREQKCVVNSRLKLAGWNE